MKTSDTTRMPAILGSSLARLATTLFLVALAAPSHAAGNTSAFADTTKPVTFLREMIVTGARYPRAYYQSPQALSFVSRAQLREQAPVVTGDVLASLPGVDNSKDSPWEQRPVLRGLSGQRVLVLMDGVPMNSARGNGPHPSLVDPSQIERVEVVRGPSSVSYGSDALGGAINIITRGAPAPDGSHGVSGSASMSGSTADQTGGGSLELSPRLGAVTAHLAGGYRGASNFTSPDGEVPHSSFRDYNGMGDLRWGPTANVTVDAGYQMYRGNDIGIPGLSSPTASYPDGMQQFFAFKNYDRDQGHLSIEHRYAHSWIASSRINLYGQAERRNFYSTEIIGQQAYPTFGINFDPNSTGSAYRQTDQDRFFNLKTWGGQFQTSSIQTKTYRFTMGLDASRDITGGDNIRHRGYHFTSTSGADSAGTVAKRTTQSVPNGHFDNYGVFFQNEWYVAPKWTLSTGARWTSYHYRSEAGVAAPASGPSPAQMFPALSVDNNAACGSLGLVFAPTSEIHWSVNVANGYRQPNAQDLFFNGPASVGTVLGDPTLKPEKSISYDTGLRLETSRVALSGNLFLSTYDDLIDAVDVTPPGNPPGAPHVYQYTNISKARIWGGEAEAEYLFMRHWRARTTMAGAIGDITSREANKTLYGVDTDKSALGGVPPFKGTLAVRWTSTEGRAWVEPSVRYSWRTNRLPLPTPGVGQLTDFKKEYAVFDLTTGCRIADRQRVLLGVRNIGDRRYRESLASLPAPGRSFFASVTTDF